MEDKIVNRVLDGYKQRSKAGIKKYGTTLERNDLSGLDWLKHLQEELMDATLYIEALKSSGLGLDPKDLAVKHFESMLETPAYPRHKNCLITGVEMAEEDTYNKNTGCPYSNFAEKFRSRHQIPVRDLRKFVEELKSKL
tara:strand:+ start:94 stop:510 length:417 start_codon:yes stop_codon:yes gene_type:complete